VVIILNKEIKEKILIVLFACVFALCFLFYQLPDGKFHLYFLDVGQGDAIFIKTPENHQILVDGGPSNYVISELAELMSFFDRTIDLVVLTHPHADHVEGLIEVLARYEVEAVLLTGVNYDNDNYEEFLQKINEMEIPFYVADQSVDFVFGNVFWDTVYPLKQIFAEDFENINNSSIGARIMYQDKVVILTGDMEEEAELELIRGGFRSEAVDIFKAGHHGSKTASSWDFLKIIEPEKVVIQCGKDNSFNHPHLEALKNFQKIEVKEIFRNDLDGRVEFVF
jgi:competence protein ComEC